MADNFPHMFANREQYESSIRLPLGHEWNTLAAHRWLPIFAAHFSPILPAISPVASPFFCRTLVQPAVTVKAGKMIKPIAVPKSKLRSVGAEKVMCSREPLAHFTLTLLLQVKVARKSFLK